MGCVTNRVTFVTRVRRTLAANRCSFIYRQTSVVFDWDVTSAVARPLVVLNDGVKSAGLNALGVNLVYHNENVSVIVIGTVIVVQTTRWHWKRNRYR